MGVGLLNTSREAIESSIRDACGLKDIAWVIRDHDFNSCFQNYSQCSIYLTYLVARFLLT